MSSLGRAPVGQIDVTTLTSCPAASHSRTSDVATFATPVLSGWKECETDRIFIDAAIPKVSSEILNFSPLERGFHDLRENRLLVVAILPARVVVLKLPNIAHVPHVIARARLFGQGVR